MPVKPHPTDPDKMSVEWSPEEDEAFNEVEKQSNLKSKQGVAEGSGKNVVKSVKVGNFRHDLVNTGMGWQVRIYNGDELYDTGLSKNSEEKGLAALDNSVAYTKKQLNIKEQSVAEGAPELLKAEMPLVRHIERELTQHGYEKGTSEYNEHFKHALAYYRKFGNIDAIKKGVAEEQLEETSLDAMGKREWVGLTYEERNDLYEKYHDQNGLPKQGYPDGFDYERAIEAKLKQKNGYAEEKNT